MGPFFSVLATFLGSKNTWNNENAKNFFDTQWIDQECMLSKACVFRNLLLAEGKVHTAKMHFFQNGLPSFLDCVFYHVRDVENEKMGGEAFSDFGELEWALSLRTQAAPIFSNIQRLLRNRSQSSLLR